MKAEKGCGVAGKRTCRAEGGVMAGGWVGNYPEAIGGAVDISLEEWDNLSESSD